MPLRRLFALQQYPSDVMTLYAQGYSVSNFLVSASSRPAFLAFVAFALFLVVQAVNRFRRKEEPEPTQTEKDVLVEIRNLLARRSTQ